MRRKNILFIHLQIIQLQVQTHNRLKKVLKRLRRPERQDFCKEKMIYINTQTLIRQISQITLK